MIRRTKKEARAELGYSILAFVMAIAFGTLWASVVFKPGAGVCGGSQEHVPASQTTVR